ncbi:hypothetical protein BKA93DRAFT_700311, partial [Sparassis latifolia]
CYDCRASPGLIRCSDCFDAPLLCEPCTVRVHRWNPFHHIQRWQGSYFECKTLFDIGLILFLGHHGRPCPHI